MSVPLVWWAYSVLEEEGHDVFNLVLRCPALHEHLELCMVLQPARGPHPPFSEGKVLVVCVQECGYRLGLVLNVGSAISVAMPRAPAVHATKRCQMASLATAMMTHPSAALNES
jgi:hypothetical protein